MKSLGDKCQCVRACVCVLVGIEDGEVARRWLCPIPHHKSQGGGLGETLCSSHMLSGGNQEHGPSRTAWGIREWAVLTLPGDS